MYRNAREAMRLLKQATYAIINQTTHHKLYETIRCTLIILFRNDFAAAMAFALIPRINRFMNKLCGGRGSDDAAKVTVVEIPISTSKHLLTTESSMKCSL